MFLEEKNHQPSIASFTGENIEKETYFSFVFLRCLVHLMLLPWKWSSSQTLPASL